MIPRTESEETDLEGEGSARAGASDAVKRWPKWRKDDDPPDDLRTAWDLYCRGHDNYSAICRTLGYPPDERKKAQRDLVRLSKMLGMVEDDPSVVDARGEALTKLRRQEIELWRIHNEAPRNPGKGPKARAENAQGIRTRLWALKQLAEINDRIAAIKGVATRRDVHERGDEEHMPPVFNINIARRAVESSPLEGDDRADAEQPAETFGNTDERTE